METTNQNVRNNLLLGIDTVGTNTAGVLFDNDNRQVIATAKALTTRHDLTRCILKVLDELLPDDPGQIRLVSISTTLATNAIAEGKGRPVALFLLRYDPDLVKRFQLEGHFAISGYFSPFNASHEERAFRAISEATGLPIVLGHQLSSKLKSIRRATTASLNASLLSILQGFIQAMRTSLDERQVIAPLMVVQGDGALMSSQMAEQRPVETVHSGPAASAIGGRFLADRDPALVIDIGGTTTDIAVVDRSQVSVCEEGTSIGPYKTAVRAAKVRSIGLGGDSFIGFNMEHLLFEQLPDGAENYRIRARAMGKPRFTKGN